MNPQDLLGQQVQHIADALEVTRDKAVRLLAEARKDAPPSHGNAPLPAGDPDSGVPGTPGSVDTVQPSCSCTCATAVPGGPRGDHRRAATRQPRPRHRHPGGDVVKRAMAVALLILAGCGAAQSPECEPAPTIVTTNQPDHFTAVCKDGYLSFAKSRRGACSKHGGVARWYGDDHP
jgi:hypothetical protein